MLTKNLTPQIIVFKIAPIFKTSFLRTSENLLMIKMNNNESKRDNEETIPNSAKLFNIVKKIKIGHITEETPLSIPCPIKTSASLIFCPLKIALLDIGTGR